MNNNTNLYVAMLLMLIYASSYNELAAQQLALEKVSLEECYLWTHENYPLIQQLELIDKSTEYNLSNTSKGFLPQINLNGQASYQSDVTEFPISLPNLDVPSISKDQYKIFADIYMPLSSFRKIQTSKLQLKNNGEIEKQSIKIDLHKLKERVNQLFFGALLISEKTELLRLNMLDLDSALVKVQIAVENGIATSSEADFLKVEQISISQKIIEGESNRLAFIKMLALLTGKNIDIKTVFSPPTTIEIAESKQRPELIFFDLNINSLSLSEKQIHNKLLPNAGLFLQAGYGRPALNFLDNDFAAYYLGGLKFNWNISNYYTAKNEKQNLELSRKKILIQKETFRLNTNLIAQQQNAEVTKFLEMIKMDNDIIDLRKSLKETASVQLENGIISSLDFVKYINDLNRARQDLALHNTQLLLSQHNLRITNGN